MSDKSVSKGSLKFSC